MRVKTIVVSLLLTLAMIAAVLDHGVKSQSESADSSTGTTDQANIARTTDATYTPGSVDLEGVPANDQTTYTFRTDVNPPAAGGPPAGESKPGSGFDDGSAVIIDDGGGGGGGAAPCLQPQTSDALTGFDDKTNNFIPQGTPPPDCTEPVPGTFLHDKAIFEEVDLVADGLGPVYNAQSCKECHQNPVTGAISQINELRAGHTVGTTFFDAPGGSLINDRGIPTPNYNPNDLRKSAKVQERVPPLFTAAIISGPALVNEEPTRTFRTSLNTLGDGFVEAVADGTIVAIANNQPGTTANEVHGTVINVPVLEANFQTNPECANPNLPCVRRVARFGWKNQHASLLSFSADAYLNEIGITNFLVRNENTSLGRFVGFGTIFDVVPDNTPCDAPNQNILCGEDTAQDVKVFAQFMRATKAPPRDPDIISQFQADVNAGAALFATMVVNGEPKYSCSVCHVPSIVTAPACTSINGGTFSVPVALANKVIKPFSDFLLHDIGTGDFIVQNGGPITRTMVRTPPLWGVRTRTRLMHDGESLTFNEAILRHSGEATQVRLRYQALTTADKRKLITFLESL
jgi:CxxC motif-containing protein (DUF1111 family)